MEAAMASTRWDEDTRTLEREAVPRPVTEEITAEHQVAVVGSGPTATMRQPYVIGITGAAQGELVPVGAEPLVIGRSSDAGLRVLDDSVPRHHGRLSSAGRQA